MPEVQQSSDIYGILWDQSKPQVLMLQDDAGGWTLPHVHIPDKRVWPAMVGIASSSMGNVLAADITILRRVHASYSDDRSHIDLINELENHSADWQPPAQAKWIDISALDSLMLTHPEHRAVIETEWQAIHNNQIPVVRPVWAREGWFKVAAAWMQEQLVKQGYVLKGSPEQVKSWGISCILKVATDRGDVFFKVASSLPLFGNEPKVTKALAELYPECVPGTIAIEPEKRWMLLEDFGAELLTMPTLERYEIAVRRFGEIQVKSASIIDDLLAVGCLDRRLAILSGHIDPLLNDETVITLFSPDEIARLGEIAPRLKAMCGELAGYSVPYTLNHGDFHNGNITGEKQIIFDWTDACIAHPFLDLITVVAFIEDEIPGGREQVLDMYLNLWTAYEPMERLRAMWELAEPLGALHQAVSYQHILAALEPTSRPELMGGMRDWLRLVLKTMPE